MSVDLESSVAQLLNCFPQAAQVFIRRRMHCVGCPMARFETLAEVCAIYRQPLDRVLAELAALTGCNVPAPHHEVQ